jgi:hypothetical protein
MIPFVLGQAFTRRKFARAILTVKQNLRFRRGSAFDWPKEFVEAVQIRRASGSGLSTMARPAFFC